MKKWILLAMLAVGALILGATSEAKADHMSGCGPSYGGGGYYSGYSYAPSYYSRSYYAPSYNYGPVNSFSYAYPTTGFYYGSPGISFSIGSGYRGYGNSGYSNYSYGGYGRGWSGGHHHRH